jgi:hypothetical protein
MRARHVREVQRLPNDSQFPSISSPPPVLPVLAESTRYTEARAAMANATGARPARISGLEAELVSTTSEVLLGLTTILFT